MRKARFTALLGIEIVRAFEDAQALATDSGLAGVALEARMSGTRWRVEGEITTPVQAAEQRWVGKRPR